MSVSPLPSWAHALRGRRYVDTKSAAHHVSLHPDTLRRYRREGGGPPYSRVGRAVRYDIEELERWMAERTVSHMAEEAAGGGES